MTYSSFISTGCKYSSYEEEDFRHPFGSFRHKGSFPASLIGGSLTSRHLRRPSIDFHSYATSTEQTDTVYDASTHIYINMIERSKLVMSTEFRTESTHGIDISVGNSSEFSGIQDECEMRLEDFCLDDHRGGVESWQCAETFGKVRPDVINDPLKMSVSDKTGDHADCTNDDEASHDIDPPPVILNCAKTAFESSKKQCLSISDNKVAIWLEQMNGFSRERPTFQREHFPPAAPLSDTSSSTFYSSATTPSNSLWNSLEHTNSAYSLATTVNNQVAATDSVETERATAINEHSVYSDASSFMNHSLIRHGVTGKRPGLGSRKNLLNKIRTIGKLFTKKIRSRPGTH